MVNNIYLAFGSNVGDKEEFIRKSLDLLEESRKIKILKISSLYTTKPFGYVNQADFINCVCKARTELNPEDLFGIIKRTEEVVGRKKRERWGPREIDIDLLFYESIKVKTDLLEIPHPGVLSRDFVALPMLEIEKDFICPGTSRKLSELLNFEENTITGIKDFER